MFVFASSVQRMASLFRQRFLVCILVVVSVTACRSKKLDCPRDLRHWPGSGENQEASDGKKSAGENLDKTEGEANKTEGEAREVEFSSVRVKRDKNGTITKKQPKKPKKKTKL